MPKISKSILAAAVVPLLLLACKGEGRHGGKNEAVPVKWESKSIRKGLVWHSFRGIESVSGGSQVLNVLELDLLEPSLKLSFQYYPAKTTLSSAIAATTGAIAGTNASFGTPHTFIRTDGTTWCDISEADPTDSGNWWKHEAAIWYDGDRQVGFLNYEGHPYEAIDAYKATTYPNLFSTEPLLIDDYEDVKYVGKKNTIGVALHPRTAVALTADNKLLLITVDGRWYGMARGMTHLELRDFIRLNFNPQYAIAMDGGGSTTMYVQGQGRSGIVNYPCNNNGASSGNYAEYEGSFTERTVPTFFIISEVPASF